MFYKHYTRPNSLITLQTRVLLLTRVGLTAAERAANGHNGTLITYYIQVQLAKRNNAINLGMFAVNFLIGEGFPYVKRPGMNDILSKFCFT